MLRWLQLWTPQREWVPCDWKTTADTSSSYEARTDKKVHQGSWVSVSHSIWNSFRWTGSVPKEGSLDWGLTISRNSEDVTCYQSYVSRSSTQAVGEAAPEKHERGHLSVHILLQKTYFNKQINCTYGTFAVVFINFFDAIHHAHTRNMVLLSLPCRCCSQRM